MVPSKRTTCPSTTCRISIELARRADVLMLTCPGGMATRNLIGAAVLEALGTARLARQHRPRQPGGGAGAPRGAEIGAIRAPGSTSTAASRAGPELAALPNVSLYPHHSSATFETRDAMSQLALDNIAALLAGKPALTPV